jgi:general secretion pathway protein I
VAKFVMKQGLCTTKSKRSGFTLLEIMIALAIVSIAMISLLALANRSIGVHDRLQRITSATLLAQQKMAETELNARKGATAGADVQGVFNDPYSAYRWQIAYADTPLPSVRMVTVTVLWGDEERNELVDLTSFIF